MVGKSSLTLARPRTRRRSLPMERVFSGRISAGASLTGTCSRGTGTFSLFLCLQRQLDDPLLGKAQGVVVAAVVVDGLSGPLLREQLPGAPRYTVAARHAGHAGDRRAWPDSPS